MPAESIMIKQDDKRSPWDYFRLCGNFRADRGSRHQLARFTVPIYPKAEFDEDFRSGNVLYDCQACSFE